MSKRIAGREATVTTTVEAPIQTEFLQADVEIESGQNLYCLNSLPMIGRRNSVTIARTWSDRVTGFLMRRKREVDQAERAATERPVSGGVLVVSGNRGINYEIAKVASHDV